MMEDASSLLECDTDNPWPCPDNCGMDHPLPSATVIRRVLNNCHARLTRRKVVNNFPNNIQKTITETLRTLLCPNDQFVCGRRQPHNLRTTPTTNKHLSCDRACNPKMKLSVFAECRNCEQELYPVVSTH